MPRSTLAWVDPEGLTAFVIVEGLAAVRNFKGVWAPMPDGVTIGSLSSDGYRLADEVTAESLVREALIALENKQIIE